MTKSQEQKEIESLINRGIDYANPDTTWKGIDMLIEFKLKKQKCKVCNKEIATNFECDSCYVKGAEVMEAKGKKEMLDEFEKMIERCEELSVYANHKTDTKQLAWGDMVIRIEDLKILAEELKQKLKEIKNEN